MIKRRHNILSILVSIFLVVIGLFIICITWNNDKLSMTNFFEYLKWNFIVVVFSLFLILIGLYCIFYFIRNVIAKPKEDVLYLENIYGDVLVFYNRKGKNFEYRKEDLNKRYDKNLFYDVKIKNNEIIEIIKESISGFEIKEKKVSFWENMYTPFGNFEGISLLPIVYVILLPGIVSLFFLKGASIIYGIIYSIFPGFFVIYDFYKKYIEKK